MMINEGMKFTIMIMMTIMMMMIIMIKITIIRMIFVQLIPFFRENA
jgi:hypothetical protein